MGNTESIKQEFGLIIVGAIIFTASFLWKDLISDIQDVYFPKINGLMGRLIFTAFITIILVMVAVHLRGLLGINTPSRQSSIQFDDDPIGNNDSSASE